MWHFSVCAGSLLAVQEVLLAEMELEKTCEKEQARCEYSVADGELPAPEHHKDRCDLEPVEFRGAT